MRLPQTATEEEVRESVFNHDIISCYKAYKMFEIEVDTHTCSGPTAHHGGQ